MKTIFCCGCQREIEARLTYGAEIYPHRRDLWLLPFWKCDGCQNYVGCHHNSRQPHSPLGNIPTAIMRALRIEIHSVLDGLWKHKGFRRGDVYRRLSQHIGRPYHTGEIRTVEEALAIKGFLADFR